MQVTCAASFPAPAFPGLRPSQLWVLPAGHGPTTVPVEGRSRSRPPFQFALCALECAAPRHVSLQGQEPRPGTAEESGALGNRWHLCSVPALPWGSGSHLNPFPAAWVPAEALPCPQPCPGLAVKSGLRARRCAGQPSAPPPSFAAAWLLSRGAPSSSPPPAAGGRSPNAFIPYVHAVNPLLPVPVPRSPAFPCRRVRSALPPSCCRTD